MTDTPGPTTAMPDGARTEASGADRPVDLRLARLHLRTGLLALARVELESLAGAGMLDEDGLLDLAEVRWRTDDLAGAGEAAAAYISSGREALVALVIAAEGTAAVGRPAEARRLAGWALELADGPLDPVFAGIPRSGIWPAEPLERAEALPVTARTPAWSSPLAAGPVARIRLAAAAASPGGGPVRAAGTAPAAESDQPDADTLPDPAAELEAARAALAAGDRSGAAIRLAVVLRLGPVLAPAVLDVVGAEPGPAFDLVRGDALRLVGRETQARRAYAAAARHHPEGRRPAGGDDATAGRAAAERTPEEGT